MLQIPILDYESPALTVELQARWKRYSINIRYPRNGEHEGHEGNFERSQRKCS